MCLAQPCVTMDEILRLKDQLTQCSSYEDFVESVDEITKQVEIRDGHLKSMLHSHLCQEIIKSVCHEWVLYDGPHSQLLHALGHVTALEIITNGMPSSSLIGAKWLEKETVKIITDETLEEIMWEQSSPTLTSAPSNPLSLTQHRLIKSLTRLPDILSNKRGRELSTELYPVSYYRRLGEAVFNCLNQIHDSLQNSKDVSVKFLATLLGQCCLVGHKDAVWSVLCKKLEDKTKHSMLWHRICHALFERIPQQCLEPSLDGVFKYITPSLSSPCPLYGLLGNLPVDNSHAKFLLTCKYVIVKTLSEPRILVGYLTSNESLRILLIELLLVALRLWADGSALRHMTELQHRRLSGMVAIATTCVDIQQSPKKQQELERLVMQGVQSHLENSSERVRVIGMVIGEHLMKSLQPKSVEKLSFTYDSSEEVCWVKSLMKPIEEQEKELLKAVEPVRDEETEVIKEDDHHDASPLHYGTGFVQSTTCNDDSDDDLQPYDMSNDPDSNQTTPPCYLRTCLKDLLSKDNPGKQDSAIRNVRSLIIKRPPDLVEVSPELAKVLLHVDVMDDVTNLRFEALIELTVQCPAQVAPYLCDQFYSPHYNQRQRIDILQILSEAALSLSSPNSKQKERKAIEELSPRILKPWQQVVEERIKAKTRIISKGSSRIDEPSTNRFSSVCGEFFFPLMSQFDNKLNTLDLLGRDSLILGHLLHALGTILQAAIHCPLVPVMSTVLLDFCWGLKYHTNVFVRQGVIYCVCCILSCSSSSSISNLMDNGLNEMLLWIKGIVTDEANVQCRQLAGVSLSLFQELIH